MKAFFKVIGILFLASLVFGLLGTLWVELIASDETKMEMEFDSIKRDINTAVTSSELKETYVRLDIFKKTDSTNVYVQDVDSLFALKTNKLEVLLKKETDKKNNFKKRSAFKIAKHFTLEQLKAPSTAKFPNYENENVYVVYNPKTNTAIVGLYVDAQNSFGAMMRTKFNVTLRNSKLETWDLLGLKKVN